MAKGFHDLKKLSMLKQILLHHYAASCEPMSKLLPASQGKSRALHYGDQANSNKSIKIQH